MTTDTSFEMELERALTHLAAGAPHTHVPADLIRQDLRKRRQRRTATRLLTATTALGLAVTAIVYARHAPTSPPAASSVTNGDPVGGGAPDGFPVGIPLPDVPHMMSQDLTADGVRFGWEMYIDDVSAQACLDYARKFGASPSRAKPDEHAVYARVFTIDQWDILILCSGLREFLVQVMPKGWSTAPPANVLDSLSPALTT
jgi:hypothetical protein